MHFTHRFLRERKQVVSVGHVPSDKSCWRTTRTCTRVYSIGGCDEGLVLAILGCNWLKTKEGIIAMVLAEIRVAYNHNFMAMTNPIANRSGSQVHLPH